MTFTKVSVRQTATAANDFRALRRGVVDLRLDLRDSGFVDQRADGNAFLEAAARSHLGDAFFQSADKVVDEFLRDIHPVRADAGLAGVEELHQLRAFGSVHGVGVVEDHERCMAAEFA